MHPPSGNVNVHRTSVRVTAVDFRLAHSLPDGMAELHRKMLDHGFSKADFEGDRFVRLRMLKKRYGLLQEAA